MLVADAGNVELGTPTVTTSLRGTGSVLVTVRTMAGPAHSGMYGGAAPDALAALIARAGHPARRGRRHHRGRAAAATGPGTGADYPAERFAADAQVLPGVALLGVGLGRRHRVGAAGRDGAGHRRPVGRGRDRRDPARGPGGGEPPGAARPGRGRRAQRLLVRHLEPPRPVGRPGDASSRKTLGQPFAAGTRGPGFAALAAARWRTAYGRDLVTAGQGGAIPLCNALAGRAPGCRDPADRAWRSRPATSTPPTRASTPPSSNAPPSA